MGGFVGSGLYQPPVVAQATMDAVTQRWLQPVIGDAIFIPSTALGEMTSIGRKIDSADIPFAVAARQLPGGGAFWGTQQISLEVPDPVQPAVQSWKYYRQPLAVSLTDLWTNQASSPTGVLNLIRAYMIMLSGTFLTILSNALWGDPTQPSGLAVDDINAWLNNTTNTIAGINRSTAGNTFWVPNAAYSIGGAMAMAPMVTGYWSYAGNMGFDYPQDFFFSPTGYANFMNLFVNQIRYFNEFPDDDMVQTAFKQGVRFFTTKCIPDPYLASEQANTAFLINYKYIYPIFFSRVYFRFTPWIQPSNQLLLSTFLLLGWNITCVSPKKAGQVFTATQSGVL
jgi:hypothetical protein